MYLNKYIFLYLRQLNFKKVYIGQTTLFFEKRKQNISKDANLKNRYKQKTFYLLQIL